MNLWSTLGVVDRHICSWISEEKRNVESSWRKKRRLAKKGIPERENRDIKLHVIKKVQQELEDDEAGNLDGLFYTLSLDQQTFIQSCMPLNTMKKVIKFFQIHLRNFYNFRTHFFFIYILIRPYYFSILILPWFIIELWLLVLICGNITIYIKLY